MSAKIGNQNFINNTLKNNNLDAKKKFGQNFLTDQNILSSICDVSELDKETAANMLNISIAEYSNKEEAFFNK